MTPTIDEVLREWRKIVSPGDQVRHEEGSFGEVLGKASVNVYELDCRWDDGLVAGTYRKNLFPSWWPKSQWIHESVER